MNKTPDHSNDHFNGDRPACEEPTQPKYGDPCNDCKYADLEKGLCNSVKCFEHCKGELEDTKHALTPAIIERGKIDLMPYEEDPTHFGCLFFDD